MTTISILIPTKNRQQQITRLLDSIRRLAGLDSIRPEIIVGDNGSGDQTWKILKEMSGDFPVPLRPFRIAKPGKCRILNEAIRIAEGDVLAFLDDDVVVDPRWLSAVTGNFRESFHLVAQGAIRIPPEELQNPEIINLIQRYRTVDQLEYDDNIDDLNTLNGANMVLRREVLAKVGNFDLRLGPGASGTSEDVELAGRIRRAGIKISYMPDAMVYHEVERTRLTDGYFKTWHQRQGISRLIYKDQSSSRIFFDLCRATAQYGYYSLVGRERNRYRSMGRVYHYCAMLRAKMGIYDSK